MRSCPDRRSPWCSAATSSRNPGTRASARTPIWRHGPPRSTGSSRPAAATRATYPVTEPSSTRSSSVGSGDGSSDACDVVGQRAHDMLYSDLDADQQRIYDDLVAAGVLPDRTVHRATD
ncbi:hypothetical protein MHOL44478_11345 [Mycobacterium holsaticum DSM 44478]|nr:hypothetical protein [Mycolicibacterium holsaticum DSM 44478 = JCM 12374]